MRKLIPLKIQFDVEDVRARFAHAFGKNQVTEEQMSEVNKTCDKLLSILPNVKRVRGKENNE